MTRWFGPRSSGVRPPPSSCMSGRGALVPIDASSFRSMDRSSGAHDAVDASAIRALRGRDARHGGALIGDTSFPYMDERFLLARRIIRAALTSRSWLAPQP